MKKLIIILFILLFSSRLCADEWKTQDKVWQDGQWWIEDPALGNFTNKRDYKTSHHLGWKIMVKYKEAK